jgi:2-C-methyl-D-erythritol 4-phosphate cytidylyltransferase
MSNVSVIIAGGGSASRFGGDTPKQFLSLAGEPVIVRAIKPFAEYPDCRAIAVAIPAGWFEWMTEMVNRKGWSHKIRIVPGGKERGDSVYNGLKALPRSDVVLIHDAGRPFVTMEMIDEVANSAMEYGGAVIAIPVTDTLKRESDGFIIETVDRWNLWRMQTPQAFRYDVIVSAYDQAMRDRFYSTDDCAIVEKYADVKIKLVLGSERNIKITTKEDFAIAEALGIGHQALRKDTRH